VLLVVQWVRDRMGLEQLKPPDVNEIILHADDGALLEGTQTNFYVIRHGKVYIV
jgi:branched-subunit amino acid aminotransferase/4-amino-4-deoxychorismate lyase